LTLNSKSETRSLCCRPVSVLSHTVLTLFPAGWAESELNCPGSSLQRTLSLARRLLRQLSRHINLASHLAQHPFFLFLFPFHTLVYLEIYPVDAHSILTLCDTITALEKLDVPSSDVATVRSGGVDTALRRNQTRSFGGG